MIIEFEGNKNNDRYLEEGMVLISENDDIHLIIETENECFDVFDLETNTLRCFYSEEDFEEEYPTKKIYYRNEIKITLTKSN